VYSGEPDHPHGPKTAVRFPHGPARSPGQGGLEEGEERSGAGSLRGCQTTLLPLINSSFLRIHYGTKPSSSLLYLWFSTPKGLFIVSVPQSTYSGFQA